jgi:multimeric flavodoxin WrbA
MKFLILNGSPKGKYSITVHTCLYLEFLHPEHQFTYLNVGQTIKSLEKDFSPAEKALTEAELILFSYPVYTFIAPYQLHRFMELLKESSIDLRGKFASQITTSKHFYDMTAHRYIQENCDDLGLRYVRGLSADMDDLTTKKGQKDAQDFFKYLIWSVENGSYEQAHANASSTECVAATVPECNEGKSGDVVIVTDCEKENTQLANMIARFQAKMPRKTRVINIREYPMKGGCLGCFNCAVSGKCVYKDGFDHFLRNEIQTAESIVYAFSIKDHSMGARFKMYDDRNFCNGHRTVTIGMPVGYLVSGNLAVEANLQTIMEARAQVGSNFLAGIATDQQDTDGSIDLLCQRLSYALENKYVPPQNFYGVGGMKVFRDLIWLMQGMMRADHKFYKAHGQYDFPQKQWPKMIAMYAVGAMIANPKLKAKIGNQMNEGMVMPYKKVLDNLNKK